jgi:predicted transcriptional regulator of viral defense system
MRNDNKSRRIRNLIRGLPFFNLENLKILNASEEYLRIFLSREEKSGRIVRLKKGFYTSKEFVEKTKNENKYNDFLEFLAYKIYEPSYLSLDYVLYENNLLTEIPANFTLVTKNKTATFSNKLGNFIYHKIKDELFFGFEIVKKGDFLIYKATKAKALFDFLYLRKNLLINKEAIKALRINTEELSLKDKKEIKKYIEKEGSKVMKRIYLNIL